MHSYRRAIAAGFVSFPAFAGYAVAQEEDLAKKLSNPVAALISVPFQFNYDGRIGPGDDGGRATLNIQPVIPFAINPEWNVISRTILPIISQWDIAPGTGRQFGLGDTTQSFFFSPSTPGPSGIIWGLGPVVRLPTATDDLLGGNRWGMGPTLVVLKQTGGWTIGALANHVWSVGAATRSGAGPVNATFLQPFVSYTTADAWTFTLNTESTYDWANDKLTVPINAVVAKLIKVGTQPISLFVGARYYAMSPESGPKGLGLRAGVTLLFPK
ncbi:transporter [Microvirga brassicacearum]|uniref:Transporter n=1 Tax=Microvirga brassicacearum TaxID=2580413 RepID=A0A5N3PC48_9HYPH|nr:transporter [Microvirga brassicacearum]KAB0267280.1 transporter [Microvirga brassicacearum]